MLIGGVVGGGGWDIKHKHFCPNLGVYFALEMELGRPLKENS